jgi:hypothetical protein
MGPRTGGGERLKDWAPKTMERCGHLGGGRRLVGIAIGDDPLAARAKMILGSRIRGRSGSFRWTKSNDNLA